MSLTDGEVVFVCTSDGQEEIVCWNEGRDQTRIEDARLIALGPDTATLLADAIDALNMVVPDEHHPACMFNPDDEIPFECDCGRGDVDALLDRFARLGVEQP